MMLQDSVSLWMMRICVSSLVFASTPEGRPNCSRPSEFEFSKSRLMRATASYLRGIISETMVTAVTVRTRHDTITHLRLRMTRQKPSRDNWSCGEPPPASPPPNFDKADLVKIHFCFDRKRAVQIHLFQYLLFSIPRKNPQISLENE